MLWMTPLILTSLNELLDINRTASPLWLRDGGVNHLGSVKPETHQALATYLVVRDSLAFGFLERK